MDARSKIREAMARAEGPGVRVAAEAPMPPQPGGSRPADSLANPGQRQIPKNHKYDPKSLKPLARMLWAMSVSMGHALQAYRTFNRVKSSTISPDGMLGGRGYVMKVTELRQKLYDACEALSMVTDTIHDEINGPHWKPKLAELDEKEVDAIDRLIGESEENIDNPEEDAEEGEQEAEKSGKPSENWPPKSWSKEKGRKKKDGPSSELPDGGDQEVVKRPSPPKPGRSKEASIPLDWHEDVVARVLNKTANSSLPTQTLPGPRVQHLDRADTDQTGPGGSVNPYEPSLGADGWALDGGFPSTWEEDETKLSQSGLPVDGTPTEGLDFGLGGKDLARGEGLAGNGGVYSPAAELPDDPGGATKPTESDSTRVVEHHLQERAKRALDRLQNGLSQLPSDGEGVARSDYYDGWKPDNDMNTVRSDSVLPGDDTEVREEFDKDLMDTGYRYERPGQSHAEWDNTER